MKLSAGLRVRMKRGGWCSRDVLVMVAGGRLSESESEPATIICHCGFPILRKCARTQQSQGSALNQQWRKIKSALLQYSCHRDAEWPLMVRCAGQFLIESSSISLLLLSNRAARPGRSFASISIRQSAAVTLSLHNRFGSDESE